MWPAATATGAIGRSSPRRSPDTAVGPSHVGSPACGANTHIQANTLKGLEPLTHGSLSLRVWMVSMGLSCLCIVRAVVGRVVLLEERRALCLAA